MADKSVAVLLTQEELSIVEDGLRMLDGQVDRPGTYELHKRIERLLEEMEEELEDKPTVFDTPDEVPKLISDVGSDDSQLTILGIDRKDLN